MNGSAERKVSAKEKTSLKGSLTIEITLLMPFILGAFVFVIFSGFVLHDKCVVNKACLSAALRGSEEREEDGAVDKANEALAEVLPSRLISRWTYDTQVEVGEDIVRVSFTGDTKMGSGLIRRVLSSGSTTHNYECTGFRLREAEYIRSNRKSGVGYCL